MELVFKSLKNAYSKIEKTNSLNGIINHSDKHPINGASIKIKKNKNYYNFEITLNEPSSILILIGSGYIRYIKNITREMNYKYNRYVKGEKRIDEPLFFNI